MDMENAIVPIDGIDLEGLCEKVRTYLKCKEFSRRKKYLKE